MILLGGSQPLSLLAFWVLVAGEVVGQRDTRQFLSFEQSVWTVQFMGTRSPHRGTPVPESEHLFAPGEPREVEHFPQRGYSNFCKQAMLTHSNIVQTMALNMWDHRALPPRTDWDPRCFAQAWVVLPISVRGLSERRSLVGLAPQQ